LAIGVGVGVEVVEKDGAVDVIVLGILWIDV